MTCASVVFRCRAGRRGPATSARRPRPAGAAATADRAGAPGRPPRPAPAAACGRPAAPRVDGRRSPSSRARRTANSRTSTLPVRPDPVPCDSEGAGNGAVRGERARRRRGAGRTCPTGRRSSRRRPGAEAGTRGNSPRRAAGSTAPARPELPPPAGPAPAAAPEAPVLVRYASAPPGGHGEGCLLGTAVAEVLSACWYEFMLPRAVAGSPAGWAGPLVEVLGRRGDVVGEVVEAADELTASK